MSRFQRVMEDNEIARKQSTAVPTYSFSTEQTQKKKKTLFSVKNIIIMTMFAIVLGLLYIPQFFIPDTQNAKNETLNISYLNHSLNSMAYFNNGTLDYDKDGVLNQDELDKHSSLWEIDSDGDGLTDFFEIHTLKTNPVAKDDYLLNIQKEQDKSKGLDASSPYQIGNVILWAKDYESKTYGSVIETPTGYRFSNFNGYAQFPDYEKIYVYELKNGIRKQIPMREIEKAWEISGNTEIEIYKEPLREVYKITFFGNKIYADKEPFTMFLDFLLPEKGFITSESMTTLDVDPDTRDATITEIQKIEVSVNDYARLTHFDNKIEDLAFVRKAIKDKSCIAVSLYSKELGEFIGIVYGYSYVGDLLIADLNTLSHVGVLKIDETSTKIMDNGGNLVLYQKYEFSGLGFDSKNGDRISFFAASKTSEDYNSHFNEYNSNLNYGTPSLPQDENTEDNIDFE